MGAGPCSIAATPTPVGRMAAMPEFTPTPEQQRVLSHDPRDCGCIEAGPGTGKSATLVALIEHLLSGRQKPKVRLLTFTRAATAELAQKVGGITSAAVERPSTIHSFAISVLVRNPGAADYPEPLRMADDWEDGAVVRPTLARRMGLGLKVIDDLLREMQANWEALVPADDPEIDPDLRARFIGAWQEHRQVFGYTLLSELPDLLRRALIDHADLEGTDYDLLVVDEYQDLNACDIEVLRRLADRGCAILAAGDEDQSIYGFRKAAPEGIRRFTTDYPRSARYPLTITKRCGKEIVRWARWVIEGDPDRPAQRQPLTADPDAPDGEVALLAFSSQASEAVGIADLIEHLIKEDSIAAGQVLVLFRADRAGLFSKPIKEELSRRGIELADPDVVKRALAEENNRRSLERARLTVRREDSLAWASLLVLTSGIGGTFLDYIYRRAASDRTGFGAALLAAYDQGFPDAPRSAGRARAMIAETLAWLDEHPVPETPPEEGWGHWLVALFGDQTEQPLSEDLAEVVLELDGIVDEGETLGRFIGQIQPLGADLGSARSDGVRFMSMASAKGLTVEATIVAAVEDGLIPRPTASIAEERRLLYVAMTRPRRRLYCVWSRRRYGPTARAGRPNVGERRTLSAFLRHGPVTSSDGRDFIEGRWPT